MSLKNSLGRAYRTIRTILATWPIHSLRLRLMLWYSSLMLFGLGCFGLMVLLLVGNAINANNQNAVKTETQATQARLQHTLGQQPPYWPANLKLDILDIYRMPGITIEILNTQGTSLYSSDQQSSLDLDSSVVQSLKSTNQPVWYNTGIGTDAEQVMVEATAIYVPTSGQPHSTPTTNSNSQAPGQASQPPSQHGTMIGVLLVAKSPHDTTATIALLQ